MGLIKRIKAKFLADSTPDNLLGKLETSWDIRKTIRKLQKHEWQKSDIFHIIEVLILIFCFSVIRNPPLLGRLFIGGLLLLAVLIPITSQFFLPALPIFSWLILFYTCQFIPHSWRPRIYVRVLPALETILYGGNLSNVLSSKTNSFFDIFAWIPYGLIHFGAPFVLAGILFVFAPPKTLPVFGFAFGWMNIIGVTIQILFPTAPPWYQNLYGLQPANYSMPGSPGGLARVDQILGLNMYTGSFTASPQVFGAFPSLHSGSAVMEALFCSYLLPRYTPFFFAYVLWIWWSTMYLTHHYFIDLIGGAILSFSVFYAVKRTSLPRMQFDKFARWSYDYIETGEEQPIKFRKSMDADYELPLYNTHLAESKYPDDVVSLNASPSRSNSRMATLPPIVTDLNIGSNPVSTASIIAGKNLQHSHNKSSSYHLYDSEIYATSASNSNNNNNVSSSSNSNNTAGSISSGPSSTASSGVSSNGNVSTPVTDPSSPSLAPSSSSIWSLSSNHTLSRPMSTSPVDDGKKSMFFSRIGSPSHRD